MKADKTRRLIIKLGTQCKCENNKVVEVVEEIEELERLAEIGRATELAMQDGSKHTVFAKGIDYLLEFYYRESEEE